MTQSGYLLDTTILSYLTYPEGNPCHQRVQERLESLDPASPLYMSAVSWGELEYGWRTGSQTLLRDNDRELLTRFVTLKVTKKTGLAYAEIKARLFERFAQKELRAKLKRVEQLKDPLTAYALGVQENDVWIVAQAVERGLVLVTQDKMIRIKEVTYDLEFVGFENWAGA
jgi:predicted nucleic acid-binding protein